MEYVNIKDQPNLVKDPETGQIINNNDFEYNQYVARRERRKIEKRKQLTVETDLDSMKSDLDGLKGEIGEIKSLLKELVNGK
jgi:hypothetical protein